MFVVFANSADISEVDTGEKILSAEINLSQRAEVIATMNLLADRNLHVDE